MEKERAKELMFDEGEDGEGFKDSIVVVELELIEEDAGVIRGELIIEEYIDNRQENIMLVQDLDGDDEPAPPGVWIPYVGSQGG